MKQESVIPKVVVFDLDYTLLRPSEQFEAAGYVRAGAEFGLMLDVNRWGQARRAAYAAIAARREAIGLIHDEEQLSIIARALIEGLGGGPESAVEQAAQAIIEAWSRAENFSLYEDVEPCLETLRAAHLRMAVLTNTLGHGAAEVVAHMGLDRYLEVAVSSAETGAVKPAPRMFSALFALMKVVPSDCVMVGDSLQDDVEGAVAVGAGAVLLDRSDRSIAGSTSVVVGPDDTAVPRITSLVELPAALDLPVHIHER